jgi:uncharacterized membrane protein YdfJ with MMPL/SSD domain
VARALHALGRLCARRSLLVIGVWIAAAVAIALAVVRFGAETSNDLSLPGTGSQEVTDLLEERFPPEQNGTSPIVFDVKTGKLTDDTNKKAIKESVQALRKAPHVYSVTNPVSSDGQTAGLLSKDGQTAFAPVLLDIGSGELDEEIAQTVFDATQPAQRVGMTVAAEGAIGSELSDQPTETSELVGIAAAMVILTLVLGSLVAMGLPIITAVVGLGLALAAVGLLGHLIATPDTAATLATMIGLGVGIDYSLFLITRHQDQLRAGVEMEESIARAVATSGSAIVFAGGTVVIALVSLRVSQIPLLSSLGLASAVAVLTAVLAAISLLPALLGLLKHRIHWLSLPGFMRSKHKARGGMWGTWAGFVSRHPILVIVGSLAFLIPLIIPARSLNFGQEDIGAASKATTERQAYDLITAGFGAGYNGPLEVASSLSPPAQPSSEYTQKYDKATSLQKDLEKKQKELPKQQQQLENEQEQLENEQRQLENQERQLEAQKASLETQKNVLTQREAALRRQAAELQTEQRQLEAEGQQLQAQKRELQAEKRQLQREQTRLEAKQARLEARKIELRNEARALARAARPLLRHLARIELRERILERRIERLDDDPIRQERLQARLDQLQQEEQQVRKELAPLERQAKRLAAQARTLEAQAKQLQRQADQLEAEADQLTAEGNRLQAEGNQLRAQADQLQAEGAQLERQKASLEREAASLQQEGDQLQGQATALQRQGDELQQQGDELQQQADQLKAEQQQAEQEEKQAERLQEQLTAMLTQAGGDPRGTDPRIVRLQDALSGTDGVLALTPPQLNKKGDVVLLSAVPTTAPATVATANLVGTVRDDVLPKVHDQGGITSYVGGYTASYVDLATLISNRLLLVIGTVILLGFVLLMIAFRSILVPLQAAVTNLLSAAAAFGVLTATFQWGWGTSLVGLDTTTPDVPIASYVPLMMFAVLFGLSMDYEVFLVSHIQQHHLEGQSGREAVASGLSSSARITTAAALIMASVFASFILNGDPTIKQFGVGLSVAVLLAGTLVVTLAPATLSVMGEAAWWLPRWLDRLLPHISIEGEGAGAGGREKAPPYPQGAPVPLTTSAEERPTGSAGVGGLTFREDE